MVKELNFSIEISGRKEQEDPAPQRTCLYHAFLGFWKKQRTLRFSEPHSGVLLYSERWAVFPHYENLILKIPFGMY